MERGRLNKINQMHITFAGTPRFSKLVLKELIKEGVSISSVVTREDKKKGRGQKLTPSPVKKEALENNIPVFYNLSEIIDKTDLVLVAGYGNIIDSETLKKPAHGFLNVHPSLLPKYRGPTPLQSAILSGDEETGVSIIVMDEKIDHGPILIQEKMKINRADYPELEKKTAIIGGRLLSKAIPTWVKGEMEPTPQDHQSATETELLSKEDGEIDWSESAKKIERMVRAYKPWPGSYTYLRGKRLNIKKAEARVQGSDHPSGPVGKTFLATNSEIAVQTGKDYLVIKRLQPEGKKEAEVSDFLRGNIDVIGEILG